jgi:hypothetical protein
MPVFVSYNSGSVDSACNVTVTTPSGLSASYLLIGHAFHGTGGGACLAIGAGSGWTTFGKVHNTEHSMSAWYRVTEATEDACFIFTSDVSNNYAATITAFSNIDPTTPIHACHLLALTGAAATITGSVATTASDTMLALFPVGDSAAAETYTGCPPMTEQYDLALTATFLDTAAYTESASAASTFHRDATKSGTNRRLTSFMVAISPSIVAGGGGDGTIIYGLEPMGIIR